MKRMARSDWSSATISPKLWCQLFAADWLMSFSPYKPSIGIDGGNFEIQFLKMAGKRHY
jgi:hypothetical protein